MFARSLCQKACLHWLGWRGQRLRPRGRRTTACLMKALTLYPKVLSPDKHYNIKCFSLYCSLGSFDTFFCFISNLSPSTDHLSSPDMFYVSLNVNVWLYETTDYRILKKRVTAMEGYPRNTHTHTHTHISVCPTRHNWLQCNQSPSPCPLPHPLQQTLLTRSTGVAISYSKHLWMKGCDWLGWCHMAEMAGSA